VNSNEKLKGLGEIGEKQ